MVGSAIVVHFWIQLSIVENLIDGVVNVSTLFSSNPSQTKHFTSRSRSKHDPVSTEKPLYLLFASMSDTSGPVYSDHDCTSMHESGSYENEQPESAERVPKLIDSRARTVPEPCDNV